MALVTIRGQLGSWAPEIGELVAKRLQVDYVDREIIAQVAETLNKRQSDIAAKETPPPGLLGRIAEALSRGYIAGSAELPVYSPTREIPLGDEQYLAGLTSVIKALANSGPIVIAGRGSQFILKDYPASFHILVVAPLAIRIRRIMDELHISQDAARRDIENGDSIRREFTKRYFHSELWDATNYNLVINSGHFNIEAAASIIVTCLSVN